MADNTEVSLAVLSEKIDRIHACVEKNSEDITDLKLKMSYGNGSVKAVLWIGGVIAAVVGLMRILGN
jgi:hypothetical protein